jgi:glycerophosphoryl diester phosphodiesterase
MIVIAHRGASFYAPEHTFASWDRALAMGADYLEQDLQMTADGVLVVLHDAPWIAPRAWPSCTGRVIERTLAEVRAVRLRQLVQRAAPGASPRSTLDPSPRWRSSSSATGRAVRYYIETKNPEEAPGMEEALLELLDRHGLRDAAATEWRVLIQSFSEGSLRKIHALDPSLPLIQLVRARWATPETIRARLPEIREYAVGIGPSWRDVDERLVAAARGQCLEVHPYTVNEPARMESLAGMGVTGMFTDVPDVLLAMRPPAEPRGPALLGAAAERNRQCRQNPGGRNRDS